MARYYSVDFVQDVADGFTSFKAAKKFATKQVKDLQFNFAAIRNSDTNEPMAFAVYRDRLDEVRVLRNKSTIARIRNKLYPRTPLPQSPIRGVRGDFKIVLESSTNYFQPKQGSPKEIIPIGSLQQAIDAARSYISRYDLGSDNVSQFIIYKGKTPAGYISYNGKAWSLKGEEMHPTVSLGGLFNSSYEVR